MRDAFIRVGKLCCILFIVILLISLPATSLAIRHQDSSSGREERVTENDVVSFEATSPVPRYARLTSGFGPRNDRTTGLPQMHSGIDFRSHRGAPIFAIGPGIVEFVVHDCDHNNGFYGYGNAVVIYHPNLDLWSLYAHLEDVSVSRGDQVGSGQRIGRMGDSHNGRFPGMPVHLHLEIRHRAQDETRPYPGPNHINNIDPQPFLAEHGVHYDEQGRLIHTELENATTSGLDQPETRR